VVIDLPGKPAVTIAKAIDAAIYSLIGTKEDAASRYNVIVNRIEKIPLPAFLADIAP